MPLRINTGTTTEPTTAKYANIMPHQNGIRREFGSCMFPSLSCFIHRPSISIVEGDSFSLGPPKYNITATACRNMEMLNAIQKSDLWAVADHLAG